MAKTAKDYAVTFGYGAYDGVYYTRNNPHRGNDRPTPKATPIVIEGVRIGLTGNTGLSSAPHLHTQAGEDEDAQDTVNPTKHEFKAGEVVQVGYASEWGNHVIIKGIDGYFVVYAHLSKILVKAGDKIMANTISKDELKILTKHVVHRKPNKKEYKNWVGKKTWEWAFRRLSTYDRANMAQTWIKKYPKLFEQLDSAKSDISDLNDRIGALERSNKQLEKTNKELAAKLAQAGDDTTNLNALGKLLIWFAARWGQSKTKEKGDNNV